MSRPAEEDEFYALRRRLREGRAPELDVSPGAAALAERLRATLPDPEPVRRRPRPSVLIELARITFAVAKAELAGVPEALRALADAIDKHEEG